MATDKLNHQERKIWRRILICALVLIVGLVGMNLLAGMKKPPAETTAGEIALQVETVTVRKGDYPVSMTGYGEVISMNVVPVASAVAGKVTAVHPRLEPGEMIPAGAVLFQIDDRDYRTAVTIGRQRLTVLEKNEALAKQEYGRVYRLFKNNNVGTASGVDMAEKALLSATDMVLQARQALETAEINLDRCAVRARFTGRVSHVAIEAGQFVSPGQHALTFVDDSLLEIHVSLDSRDIRRWLPFEAGGEDEMAAGGNWFPGIQQMPCNIWWTEGDGDYIWKGVLDRTIRYEPGTRTLTVAVRVAQTDDAPFPLVRGMFCRVEIPGRMMENVVRLPRRAVSFEETVYAAVGDRLKTLPVRVVREEADFVYVAEGLENGDRVITTRLIDPLENALLSITPQKTTDGQS